jgi:Asp-tRNA(Asn)/Glu-tRNA(Gln) amidotransferase A subunit family amidase
MSSLVTRPATELVRLVAAGELSAFDLVRAYLDRIGSADDALGAFVDVRAEQAIDEARRQDDDAARGVPRGLLGGLPVTVKSAIDLAGVRCETGSPARAGRIARNDATVVTRLRRAGAIVLGTTNVAEMLMGYESDNPLHGRTHNPWDLSKTPGGSSGGEAAAIASGCSAGGIGSDGGGSIRVPAHFCGICGFKPTPGRIPSTGHQPACLGPFSLIGVVGPMARTMGDLRLLDRAVAGWDETDPMAIPSFGGEPDTVPAGIRVAFFEDDGRVPVTAETRAAVRSAARAAAAAGFEVEEYLPPVLARTGPLWDVFFAEVGLLALNDELGGAERDLPILQAYGKQAAGRPPMSARDLTSAWVARDQARADYQSQLGPLRVLVCPVAAIPAFAHGERAWEVEGRRVGYLEAMRYTHGFNVLGAPAVVVPVAHTRDGLPLGVQVAGRPFDDHLVLHVAAAIERGCGGYRPPPGFAGG